MHYILPVKDRHMTGIPDEAVVAAAKASWLAFNSDPWDEEDESRWEDRRAYLNDASVMLEAAAPFILAHNAGRVAPADTGVDTPRAAAAPPTH